MVLQSLKDVSGFFAAARAAHMTSCAALASVFVFERLIARRCGAVPRRGWIILISLTAIILSGIAWLAAAVIDMTGFPAREALTTGNFKLVLTMTQFGHVWRIRFGIMLATAIGWQILHRFRRSSQATVMLIGSVALLGSLAWSGHGVDGPPVHLVADVAHLLIVSVWPAGLLPLWLMLGGQTDPSKLAAVVNRFSKAALSSVAILIATGWINTWVLIGSWQGLLYTGYGQVLLIKLALFLAALLLGAINLTYLRRGIIERQNAIRLLRWNVAIETGLMLALMLVVGYLGLLSTSGVASGPFAV